METSILIPIAAIHGFTQATKSELLTFLGLDASTLGAPPRSDVEEGEGPVELTVAVVRKIATGLSGKTTSALKVIAQSETSEFHLKDVIEAVEGAEGYLDLRGVWSALTRRTRNVTGDPDAELIWWDDSGIHDDDDRYVDHVGRVSRLTHSSLQTHFKNAAVTVEEDDKW